MKAVFLSLAYGLMIAIAVALIVKTGKRYLGYTAVIIAILCSAVGALLAILHFPGAQELLLIDFAGTMVGAAILVWSGVVNPQRRILLYKLMVGVIILLQVLGGFLWPYYSDKLSLLNYPATAFATTVLIYRQYNNEGERNLLAVFAMQGLLYILVEVAAIF